MKFILAALLSTSCVLAQGVKSPGAPQPPTPAPVHDFKPQPPTPTLHQHEATTPHATPVIVDPHLTGQQVTQLREALDGLQQANQFFELVVLRIDAANGLGNASLNVHDGKWYQMPPDNPAVKVGPTKTTPAKP